MRRDRDTVTPEWIAQAISFSFSFFFSFFKQCLNNKFLVVFFFWKNNSPRPPTFSFELQKKKKHLCSHFTVHYSTIISVLPSSLLAVSVLARTDGGRRPFVFRSFSSFSSFSSFFFFGRFGRNVVVVVVVHRQVSECFRVLQEVDGQSSNSITCLCSCTITSISNFI